MTSATAPLVQDRRRVALAPPLPRCASGCRAIGHFVYDGAALCDCCLAAAIVRSVR